jgi:hypothetical protein
MEQADSVAIGIVRAKTVRTDKLGQAVGLMGRGHFSRTPHLRKPHRNALLRKLPSGLGSGEAATDNMHLGISHWLWSILFSYGNEHRFAAMGNAI